MTAATIAGVRFSTAEILFETDDAGFADVDVTAEWVTPGPDVPGTALSAPDRTYLWVDADARHVRLPAVADGTAARSWQLRQAAPIVAAAFGNLTLHASAVCVGEAVVAFVGETGVGKSTLAWEASKAGLPPMSDDLLPVRFTDEPRVPVVNGSHPLGVVCFLSRAGTEPATEHLTPADALQLHIANGFGEHGNPAIWATQFDGYHRVSASVPHFALTVPDDRDELPHTVAWLARELEGMSV